MKKLLTILLVLGSGCGTVLHTDITQTGCQKVITDFGRGLTNSTNESDVVTNLGAPNQIVDGIYEYQILSDSSVCQTVDIKFNTNGVVSVVTVH